MSRRVALVATVGLVAALVTTGRAPASSAPAECTVLEVVDGTHLVARSLPADTATVVGRLREPVNAIGADGPLAYGLTDSGRVVTFDAAGDEHDLGRPRGYGRIVGAVAGTIVGDRWYVLAGARLYVLDVGHRSPRIVDETELHPAWLAAQVDDFDSRDGVFYGVAQHDRRHGVVVRIDPPDGLVTPTHESVPGGDGFGAASVGPDGALYARANDSHDRSTRYRIPLPAGHPTPLDSGPAVRTSDATNCLPTPPPPPPTTTTPPPTTTTEPPPPPPPTTTTTAPVPTTTPTTTRPAPTTTPPPAQPTTTPTTTVVPAPVVLPPTTRAVVPPPKPKPKPKPKPAPTVPDDDPVATTAPQVAAAAVTERKQQRQFGLAALILIIGGAASTRIRPGRRSRSTQ